MTELMTPITEEAVASLQVGDTVEISGYILCGRDAVLPKVLKMIEDGTAEDLGVDLHGQVIFHTAVSPAGVGPTSSNKLEIESSIAPLSAAGAAEGLPEAGGDVARDERLLANLLGGDVAGRRVEPDAQAGGVEG